MTSHRYRRVNVGTFSMRLICSCGWRTSIVRRNESSTAFAQWQGHSDSPRLSESPSDLARFGGTR